MASPVPEQPPVEPEAFGGTVIQRPISLWNTLTNQVWGFTVAADLVGASGVLTFAAYPPGIYQLNNGGASPISVLNQRVTTVVAAGTTATFNAHGNTKHSGNS